MYVHVHVKYLHWFQYGGWLRDNTFPRGKWHKKWRREWFDIVERRWIRFADHLSSDGNENCAENRKRYSKKEGGGKRGVGIWRITSTRCVIVNAAPRYRGLEELREKNFRLAREEKAFARRIERKIGKWFIASFAREIRCIFATVRFRWPGFYLHTGFLIKFPPSFDYGPIPAENFIETLRYLLRYDKHSLRNWFYNRYPSDLSSVDFSIILAKIYSHSIRNEWKIEFWDVSYRMNY